MQNLKLLHEVHCALELNNKNCEAINFTIDSEKNKIYFLTNKNTLIGLDVIKNEPILHYSFEQELQQNTEIIAVQFIPDTQTLCLATLDGDIFTFDPNSKKSDCVGTIESGITSMSWSPDFEVVIFTNGNGNMLLMTQEWDVVNELPLIPNQQNEQQTSSLVSSSLHKTFRPIVCWRGDGNFFAISTNENGKWMFRVWDRTCNLISTSESTLGQGPFVAWKPSGELIASSQIEGQNKRIIFFERNGLRHGEFLLREKECEILDILWNTDSDILAIPLRINGNDVIQLWTTKNYYWYLKQEICCAYPVAAVKWDPELPRVLHVVCRNGRYFRYQFCWDVDVSEGNTEFNESYVAVLDGSFVKLTPFKRITMPPPMSASRIELKEGKVNCVSFAPIWESNVNLMILSSDSSVHFYRLNSYVDILKHNRDANTKPIPPNYSKPHQHIASFKFGEKEHVNMKALRQIVWINPTTWIGVQADLKNDSIIQVTFDIEQREILDIYSVIVPKRVLRIFQNKDSRNVYVELEDGAVFLFKCSSSRTEAPKLHPQPILQFPTPCSWLSSTIMGGEEVSIGLSERFKLYINTTLISTECNSFGVHSQFFLFTTQSHTLRFMSLKRTLEENIAILSVSRPYDDTIREVENGSHIICVVPTGTKVILQMPRGNLEHIEPRALVLYYVRKLIDECHYGTAFALMKKHKLDLNLLYDHNPKLFLENVENFVKQVNDVDDLNLFISSLKNEDCTKTVFVDPWTSKTIDQIDDSQVKKEVTSQHYQRSVQSVTNTITTPQKQPTASSRTTTTVHDTTQPIPTPTPTPTALNFQLPFLSMEKRENKVNLICNKMQQTFQRLDPEKYLLCILTTYVMKNPPEVEEALKLIQQLRKREGQESESLTAEKALKYLIFLVDVNKLYDIALGMYDFDLVMMVAQKSQKDPKEYLPFLSKLQNEEKYYRQYNIDKYLGRFEKALENLAQAGDQHFEECIEFIKQHKLYKKAAEIYSKNSTDNTNKYFLRVMDLWGEFLFNQQQYIDAALVWISCQQEEKALNAYTQVGDWQNAMLIAYKLKRSNEEIVTLGLSLVESLTYQHKWKEAAFILERYCNQIEQAIQLLVRGHLWEDALRLCYTYDRTSMIETTLHPAVLQTSEALKEGITESRVRYIELYNRLVEVRYEKLIKPKQENVESLDEETASQVSASETSSVMSGASALSQVSAQTGLSFRSYLSKTNSKRTKTRKKQGRKKVSGRRGSPYEEEYLLQQINEIFPTAQFQMEVGAILRALVYFGHRDKAHDLQLLFDEYLQIVERSLDLLNTSSPTETQRVNIETEQPTVTTQVTTLTKPKTPDDIMKLLINPIKLNQVTLEKVDWKLNIV